MRYLNFTAGAAMLLAMALATAGAAPVAVAQQADVSRQIMVQLDGAYLGIEMEDVTADNMAGYKLAGERGVIVRSVEKGSPAEAAGLLEKDVILEYAATPVFSAAQMSRLVRETPVGRKVDLTVSRDGKKVSLSAKVGKREGRGPAARRIIVEPRGPEGQGPRRFFYGFPDGGFRLAIPELEWLGEGPAASKPRLGVTLQPLTDQMAEFLGVTGKTGVLVTSVIADTPAVGKLKAGDAIIGADGQAVKDPEDLTRIVARKEEGGKMELRVIRDRKEVTVAVELKGVGSRPRTGGYRL